MEYGCYITTNDEMTFYDFVIIEHGHEFYITYVEEGKQITAYASPPSGKMTKVSLLPNNLPDEFKIAAIKLLFQWYDPSHNKEFPNINNKRHYISNPIIFTAHCKKLFV